MLDYLANNIGTVVVATVLGLVLTLAIIIALKDKKKGGCSGGCAGCPLSGKCHGGTTSNGR